MNLGPPTRADAAYLELRNRILQGTLEPGSRVDYAYLSESLGLSLTPLREALRRLEADHLVVRTAHRDVIVASLSLKEARELLVVRESLDILAIRLAAEFMTAAELQEAREMLQRMEERDSVRYLKSAGLPVSPQSSMEGSRAFHRMLYCGSHNEVLIQYRDAISARSERYYTVVSKQKKVEPTTPARLKAVHAIHKDMLDAIEAHDADEAGRLMAIHYEEPEMNFARAVFGDYDEVLTQEQRTT